VPNSGYLIALNLPANATVSSQLLLRWAALIAEILIEKADRVVHLHAVSRSGDRRRLNAIRQKRGEGGLFCAFAVSASLRTL